MDENIKLIDLTYLNEISAGSDELLNDLSEMFFNQIPEYQKLLSDYYQNKDWDNLARIAHKAKSAILMVGMKNLAEQLKKIEENAKDGKNIHEYQEIIAKFVRESNTAIKELQEIKRIKKY